MPASPPTAAFERDMLGLRSQAESLAARHSCALADVVRHAFPPPELEGRTGTGPPHRGSDTSSQNVSGIRRLGFDDAAALGEFGLAESAGDPTRHRVMSVASYVRHEEPAAPPRANAAWQALLPNAALPRTDGWLTMEPFGVEVETVLHKLPDEAYTSANVKAVIHTVPALREALGGAFDVAYVDYAASKLDTAFDQWKVTTDLSLGSTDGRAVFGLEFVSPKLRGMQGVAALGTFVDAVGAYGCGANATCATHVHVNAEGYSNEQVRQFAGWFIACEHILDTFVHVPRRNDYNRYARSPLRSVSMARDVGEALALVAAADVRRTLARLINLVNPPLSQFTLSGRNHKLNLMLMRGKPAGAANGRRFEFRQYHGCTDGGEVCDWAMLVARFVHATMRQTAAPTAQLHADAFWALIGDDALRRRAEQRSGMLAAALDFAYDSREYYAVYGRAYDDQQLTESTAATEDRATEVDSAGADAADSSLRSLSTSVATTAATAPDELSSFVDDNNARPRGSWAEAFFRVAAAAALAAHPGEQLAAQPALASHDASNDMSEADVSGFLALRHRGHNDDDERRRNPLQPPSPAPARRSEPRATVETRVEVEWYTRDTLTWADVSAVVRVKARRNCEVELATSARENDGAAERRQWHFTKPTVAVARYVRELAGVRLASPWCSEARALDALVPLVEVVPGAGVPAAAAARVVFVHINLEGSDAAAKTRVVKFLLSAEAAVRQVLGNTEQAAQTLMWQPYLHEKLKGRADDAGAVAAALFRKGLDDMVRLANPAATAAREDRSFLMRFALSEADDNVETVTFRFELDPRRVMAQIAFTQALARLAAAQTEAELHTRLVAAGKTADAQTALSTLLGWLDLSDTAGMLMSDSIPRT
jgi:hypothetical protein